MGSDRRSICDDPPGDVTRWKSPGGRDSHLCQPIVRRLGASICTGAEGGIAGGTSGETARPIDLHRTAGGLGLRLPGPGGSSGAAITSTDQR